MKADLQAGGRLVGPVHDNPEAVQHQARLAVAYRSRNREDGRMLLDVLGLLPVEETP